ncbi:MAG TPA: hypothetical protein VGP82_05630 [Ktedonobacterales bacterium]|jgi:hypothetical protein|nr:hypothetical protein [Ktedonobacterales bacterium]
MQAALNVGQQSADQSAEHLVLVCNGGAGRLSIAALQPADGLTRWWFDLPGDLDGVATADGTIFVAAHTLFRINEREPGLSFALRARDRQIL